PKPTDWLATDMARWNKEVYGQSFSEFQQCLQSQIATTPTPQKKKIILVHVGHDMIPENSPFRPNMKMIKEFVEAYFLCSVEVLDPVPYKGAVNDSIPSQTGPNGVLQIDVDQFLSYCEKYHTDDSYCVIVVTMIDFAADGLAYAFGTGD